MEFENPIIHISDIVMDDSLHPYKLINVQVRMNVEEVQDARNRLPTIDGLASAFGDCVKEAFLHMMIEDQLRQ